MHNKRVDAIFTGSTSAWCTVTQSWRRRWTRPSGVLLALLVFSSWPQIFRLLIHANHSTNLVASISNCSSFSLAHIYTKPPPKLGHSFLKNLHLMCPCSLFCDIDPLASRVGMTLPNFDPSFLSSFSSCMQPVL